MCLCVYDLYIWIFIHKCNTDQSPPFAVLSVVIIRGRLLISVFLPVLRSICNMLQMSSKYRDVDSSRKQADSLARYLASKHPDMEVNQTERWQVGCNKQICATIYTLLTEYLIWYPAASIILPVPDPHRVIILFFGYLHVWFSGHTSYRKWR